MDVCRKLFLRGIWGSNNALLNFCYCLLGADIVPGACISLECDVAEFDLVKVGRNAVDNGAMLLGPVCVGDKSSVGLRSVVLPHTQVPAGEHLGPVTSTYDSKALGPEHARVNCRCFAEPSIAVQICLGGPITFW